MMPREQVIIKGVAGAFHITCRCIRQMFLCGWDPKTKKNYNHRKIWIKERIFFLKEIFAIDIFTYTIMSNHYHLVLSSHPDRVDDWSDHEIAKRWYKLFPPLVYRQNEDEGILEREIGRLANDKEKIGEIREWLCDPSWFVKVINEFIANKANEEEERTGNFWRPRFNCRRLLDKKAIIICMVYVDLNWLRAQLVTVPEESEFTGLQDRFLARTARNAMHVEDHEIRYADRLIPFSRDNETSPLPITETEYFELVDEIGRQIRPDKPGFIPTDTPPILKRLNLVKNDWIKTIRDYEKNFKRVVGTVADMNKLAKQVGLERFAGKRASRAVFIQ